MVYVHVEGAGYNGGGVDFELTQQMLEASPSPKGLTKGAQELLSVSFGGSDQLVSTVLSKLTRDEVRSRMPLKLPCNVPYSDRCVRVRATTGAIAYKRGGRPYQGEGE